MMRPALSKVTIGAQDLCIIIKPHELASLLAKSDAMATHGDGYTDSLADHHLSLPMRLGRRGNETRLIVQSGSQQQRPVDQKLLTLIAKGYAWRKEIVSGTAESASSIGDREGISRPYVSRLIDLSFLAPDILAAIANGTAPADLTAEKLQSVDSLPIDWSSQRVVLGFGR